jgi:lipase maturation factor 1
MAGMTDGGAGDALVAGDGPSPIDSSQGDSPRERRARDYILTRWIFLRLLGAVYLCAFVSLGVQIDGLIGSHGVLPIQPYLQQIDRQYGTRGKLLLPTLLWFSASDRALHVLWIGGAILSGVLVVGVLPVPVLVLLWALYLSLSVAGQTFLGFQWDALLLEAGLLAIFLAPMQLALWRKPKRPPSFLAILLFRWLVFRVLFLSGVLKLASKDITWRHWTALQYHYQTQPLPAWTSWYFHHLPPGFQSFSVGYMYLAELVAPPLIFGLRSMRLVAFCLIVLLQILIAVSGNFGFFNLLTIVLCVPILDDDFWPARWREHFAAVEPKPSRFWPIPILAPLAAIILIVSGMGVAEAFNDGIHWPPLLVSLDEDVEPFRSINGYGLFRVMTTVRNEIIIEGSDDGLSWRAYEFKWKPGDLHRAPQFCTPGMPRLDWQMWFAALGDVENNPWFVNLLIRLLQGSGPVLDLMGENPFPDHAPKFVRAVLYKYEFTTAEERARTGDWWKREQVGIYCPAVSLRDAGQ